MSSQNGSDGGSGKHAVIMKQKTMRSRIVSAVLFLVAICMAADLSMPQASATREHKAERLPPAGRQRAFEASAAQVALKSESWMDEPRLLTDTVTLWLPGILSGWSGPMGQPIWAAGATEEGTVALFRKGFELPSTMDDAKLSIMADTRYEVWLDGEWLGRGPARFSRVRQEFDTYAVDELVQGLHTLAVLVQYAPNRRRSESWQPALQAGLRGGQPPEVRTVVTTGTDWKAMVAPAWDTGANKISQLDLIGPMEVLDLRLLDANWMQPMYDDSAWTFAEQADSYVFPALSERTIPSLVDVPHAPIAVVESGLLSPGRHLIELEHPTGSDIAVTYSLAVTATGTTTLNLEVLDSNPISLDGTLLADWKSPNDPRRPDVLAAEEPLAPGPHILDIEVPPSSQCTTQSTFALARVWPWADIDAPCTMSSGRTLAIGLAGLELAANPGVVQSHDPGRRTLLADPIPGGEVAPRVQLAAGGAEVFVPGASTPRYVVFDFGRTLHARMSLVADGPAGTIIDAGWDERLTDGRPLPNPGSLVSNLWSQVDSWVLDGTPRELTTLDARSGRYLILQIFGTEPVTLHQVRAMEETYPVTQGGWFASSDALLDKIWQIGADSLVPNMTDAYTDTPWRERGQWWGDAMISFQINQAAFGDLALFRRGLRQMADAIDAQGRPAPMVPNGTGTTILDFGMQWLEGLYLYWRLSEDLALVEELYPAAQRLTSFLATYEGDSGLLDVAPAHWSQSALVDWPAVSSRSGESAALNALYASVLRQMGEMALALGNSAPAQAYLSRSETVQTAINEILFLPQQGCYAASRLEGELVEPSPHAQAWALRYGVVPMDQRQATADCLVGYLWPFFGTGWAAVEPLGMYAALDALGQTGRTGEALSLIREVYGDLIAQGATTWWELYTPTENRGSSLSHAWGGSPTWFLSSHVLGGLVTGPAQWHVAPHPGDLNHAQGAVPLGGSTLEIGWQHPQCGRFELSMTAPPGSGGEILLPVTRYDAEVILNGLTIWADGPTGAHPIEMTGEGLLITELGGGTHQISALFTCQPIFLPLIQR